MQTQKAVNIITNGSAREGALAENVLTGSRIRARRVDLGLGQAELAAKCGISPPYLSLIEHNRRRIGGKLLSDIGRALEVSVDTLRDGADRAVVEDLGAAAATYGDAAEMDRVEEFAGRFPGWAEVIRAQARNMQVLEHTIETLSDRLSHDPSLSSALHDVLSTATAIRSTSAILVEDKTLEQNWSDRFHRNLLEDSERLAASSQALAGFLDSSFEGPSSAMTAQEGVELWASGRDWHIAELEEDPSRGSEDILGQDSALGPEARDLARRYINLYRADVRKVPGDRIRAALNAHGPDPARVSRALGVETAVVLRRIASVPESEVGIPTGLLIADGTGTLILRKPIAGFSVPRFGAGCGLWPIYQALSSPGVPSSARLDMPGQPARGFMAFAGAETRRADVFDGPNLVTATMLILPTSEGEGMQVGSSCRICPHSVCPARREPSILTPEPEIR